MKKLLIVICLLFPLIAVNAHYDYGRMERHSYSEDGGWGFTILLIIAGVVYLIYKRYYED